MNKKPKVIFESSGESGNIYAILSNVRDALQEHGWLADFDGCYERVKNSLSYEEALKVIREYVDLVDIDNNF